MSGDRSENRKPLTQLLLCLLLASVIALLPLGFVPTAQASPDMIDSYSQANRDTETTLKTEHPSGSGFISAGGQSFMVSGGNFNLTACTFYLKRTGNPTGYAHATLYAHSGTYGSSSEPTGSALATSDDFDVSSISTSFTLYNCTFSEPYYKLLNGQFYCIVFESPSSGTIDATNYIRLGADSSSPTHSGNFFKFYSSDWSSLSGWDTIFYVYGDLCESEEDYITFSGISTNTTVGGYNCEFRVKATANQGNLSHYVRGSNATESWVNGSVTEFSAGQTTAWVNVTETLPATSGTRVEWKVWANDTNNEWTDTGLQYLTTTTVVTVTVNSPLAQRYNVSYITVNISASTSVGSINLTWYNVKNSTNWIYSNQTYSSVVNKTGYVMGTYTFYGYANNSEGTEGVTTFTFYIDLGQTVVADSGHWQDIQNAVDEAESLGGGNVYIPAGVWEFVNSGESWHSVQIREDGVNIIGGGVDDEDLTFDDTNQTSNWQTILRISYAAPDGGTFFDIRGASYTKIAYVAFYYSYRDTDSSYLENLVPIYMSNVVDFKIHHCLFSNTGFGMKIFGTSSGVIYECKFFNRYGSYKGTDGSYDGGGNVYGINFAPGGDWEYNLTAIAGNYTERTVFVEDCYFQRWRHCISTNNCAHLVFRYNTINLDNAYCSVNAHQPNVVWGNRLIEVYENTFNTPRSARITAAQAIGIKSGSGIVFNNTVENHKDFIYFETMGKSSPNNDTWPSDVYIWNNTLTDIVNVIRSWTYSDAAPYFIENVTHFFYAMPNYVPYTYPHPMREEIDPVAYWMNFRWKDLDGNDVYNFTSWELYDGEDKLTYYLGQIQLGSGSYTLKTSCHGHLINSTSLSTATYGNKYVDIILPMKSHQSKTGGYISFNDTVLSCPIHTQTSSNLTFTPENGTSNAYTMIVDVPQNATEVKRNGETWTDWTYRAQGYVIIETDQLSTWQFAFHEGVGGATPTKYSLDVTVVNANGVRLPNVKVSVRKQVGTVVDSGFTDADGVAEFSLAKGDYVVSASTLSGYAEQHVLLTKNTEITLSLQPRTFAWFSSISSSVEELIEDLIQQIEAVPVIGPFMPYIIVVVLLALGGAFVWYGYGEDRNGVIALGILILCLGAFLLVMVGMEFTKGERGVLE